MWRNITFEFRSPKPDPSRTVVVVATDDDDDGSVARKQSKEAIRVAQFSGSSLRSRKLDVAAPGRVRIDSERVGLDWDPCRAAVPVQVAIDAAGGRSFRG